MTTRRAVLAGLLLGALVADGARPAAAQDAPAPSGPAAPPAPPAPRPLVRRGARIPTRDGAALAADVLAPADGVRRPAILVQTPYGRERFTPAAVMDDVEGYAFVVVDVRGRHGSRDAPTRPGYDVRRDDGFDAVEWTAAQPWCDGRVGTWGPSALGQQQFRTAEARPPHLACAVPIVSGFGWRYPTFHPGGVLREEYARTIDRLGFGAGPMIRAHPLDDAVWRLVARASAPERIEVPVLMIGGWYDLHPDEMVEDFAVLVARSGEGVRAAHRLLLGPWTHHVVASYANDAGELPYRETASVARAATAAWFSRWLRREDVPTSAPVRYFVLGADRWEEAATWPPAGTREATLWLAAGGALSTAAPTATGAVSFDHDPAAPVPTRGGANLDPSLASGPHDQRRGVLDRADVASFVSAPLETPLRIRGRVRARLVVTVEPRVDARAEDLDADVHVRLCDVFPDGRAILLADAARRVSLRASLTTRRAVPVATPLEVEVGLPDLAADLETGHRLLVALAGSNAPRYEVAPLAVRFGVRLGAEGSLLRLPTAQP